MRRAARAPCLAAQVNSTLGHTGDTLRVARSGHAQRAMREPRTASVRVAARLVASRRAERGEKRAVDSGLELRVPHLATGVNAAPLRRPACSGRHELPYRALPGLAAARAQQGCARGWYAPGRSSTHKTRFGRWLRRALEAWLWFFMPAGVA